MEYHNPVMVEECIEGLALIPDGIYVDATFGGGGHSGAILKHLGEKGKLIAFDQDEDAGKNAINDSRFTLIRDNFRNMKHHLQQSGNFPVNGILADLGVSSYQFDTAERGFATRFDHHLDMRMDNRTATTALDVLNTYPEKELVRIFSRYGEVKNSKSLANAIVNARAKKPFIGSADFRNAISKLVPKADESTYLAKVYQALRIEINDELDALIELLELAPEVLIKDGRLVIMSYHSLEDRLVKNFISKGNIDGEIHKDIYGNTQGLLFSSITGKPVTPSEVELKNNPRSRSAKLRIAQRL